MENQENNSARESAYARNMTRRMSGMMGSEIVIARQWFEYGWDEHDRLGDSRIAELERQLQGTAASEALWMSDAAKSKERVAVIEDLLKQSHEVEAYWLDINTKLHTIVLTCTELVPEAAHQYGDPFVGDGGSLKVKTTWSAQDVLPALRDMVIEQKRRIAELEELDEQRLVAIREIDTDRICWRERNCTLARRIAELKSQLQASQRSGDAWQALVGKRNEEINRHREDKEAYQCLVEALVRELHILRNQNDHLRAAEPEVKKALSELDLLVHCGIRSIGISPAGILHDATKEIKKLQEYEKKRWEQDQQFAKDAAERMLKHAATDTWFGPLNRLLEYIFDGVVDSAEWRTWSYAEAAKKAITVFETKLKDGIREAQEDLDLVLPPVPCPCVEHKTTRDSILNHKREPYGVHHTVLSSCELCGGTGVVKWEKDR